MSLSQQRRRIEARAREELRRRYGTLSNAKKKLNIKSQSDLIAYASINLVPQKSTASYQKSLSGVVESQSRKKLAAAKAQKNVYGLTSKDKMSFYRRAQALKQTNARVIPYSKQAGFRAVAKSKRRDERLALRDKILRDLDASARRLQAYKDNTSISGRIALSKNPSYERTLSKLELASNVLNKDKVLSEIDKQIAIVERAPYTQEYKKDLLDELRQYRDYVSGLRLKDAGRYTPIMVGNLEFVPKSSREAQFYRDLAKIAEKQRKKGTSLADTWRYLGLEINDKDRWYTKAIKGVGRFGTSFVDLGAFLSGEYDKGLFSYKALVDPKTRKAAFKFFTDSNWSTLKSLPKLPKTVASGLDPRKPENWFDIMLILGVWGALKKAVGSWVKNLGRGYVASVRNAEKVLLQLKNYRVISKAAQRLIRNDIKAGIRVAMNDARLYALKKLDKQLAKAVRDVDALIKNPKVVKLGDMNALVKSKDLIKKIGKDENVFHATAASPKSLFGQRYEVLKSVKDVLRQVKKASGVPRRLLKSKGEVEKALLSYVRRYKAVIGGAKAQNVYVKRFLTRKTQDYDILVNNHKAVAEATLRYLRKKFPDVEFKFIWFKPKKMKNYVYRIKANGKDLVDFDPLPKGLKPVKVGKNYVPSSKYLAERKLSTIDDPLKKHRWKKDAADLKRLMGSYFRKTPFKKKVKDPKNVLTVRPQPKGMGPDRLKFGETQMFFDFVVPTGYAYQSLGRAVPEFWRKVMSFVSKADVRALLKKKRLQNTIEGLRKLAKNPGLSKAERRRVLDSIKVYEEGVEEFARRFDGLRDISSNARFTVLKLNARISGFPPALRKKVLAAARGKLSAKQSDVLRKELNAYINKNPNKVSVGSRTGSRAVGESEVVVPVGSRLVARKGLLRLKRKYSQDPLTGVWFDVIEVGLNTAPKSVRSSLRGLLVRFKNNPFKLLKRRFTGGDLAEMRRYKRLLAKAERLTLADYQGFLKFSDRLFARFGFSVPGGKRLLAAGRRVVPRVRKGRAARVVGVSARPRSKPGKRRAAKPSRLRSKRTSSRKATRARVKPRVSSRPRSVARTARRRLSRPRSKLRTSSRVRPKARVAPRPRSVTRTVSRPRPRPRVTSRPRARPRARARSRPRPISRSTYNRLRKSIPPRLRVRVRDPVKKRALTELVLKAPERYRPSLAAVIFDITAYKIPSRITGFEVRPVIISRK